MFSLKSLSPQYFAPAQIQNLDETGALQVHKFDVEFRRITTPEVEAIRKEAEAGTLAHEDLYARVLVGWRGILDADDQPLAFSPASLADALKVRGMRQAISKSFFDSLAPEAGAWLAGESK